MQHGDEMFIFEEETEETEPTESNTTIEDFQIPQETIQTNDDLIFELITPAEELNEPQSFAPTCDNAPYYGSESCSLDCPVNGWKLELDEAGCCCFYFERESDDDLELIYSEF